MGRFKPEDIIKLLESKGFKRLGKDGRHYIYGKHKGKFIAFPLRGEDMRRATYENLVKELGLPLPKKKPKPS